MKRKSLLFVLLMALFAPLAMNAQETLLVYDGTSTNRYVPFYGYYADEDQTNQMIYPATELADMAGGEITAMMLYWTEGDYFSGGSGVGTWTISIGETSATTLSGIDNTTSLTQVFSGGLDALFASDYTLSITFDDAYSYNGGNLLVQFSHTASSYKDYAFYGEAVTGASYCYSSQRNFLPKTTFTYEPAQQGSCPKPTGLAVSYNGGTTATVTWNGTASQYDIDVNGRVTNNVTSPYNLTGLELATTYQVMVRANCGGGEYSDYTSPKSFTTDACLTEDMCAVTIDLTDSFGDGWNGGQMQVVDANTGKVYGTYTISSGSSATYELALCPGTVVNFVYTSGSYAYENGWTIYDPAGETINEHTAGGTAATSGIQATYTMDCSGCAKPNGVEVQPAFTTATLSWNGDNNSYVIQYRTAETSQPTEGSFFDDFETGNLNNWTLNTVAGNGWTIVEPTSFGSEYSAHSGDYAAMTRSWSSSAYDADDWLISPQITIPNSMSYWAMGDEGYPETYYVCVSLRGTDADDFEVVATYTTNPSDWTQFTVDLSAYAGRTGYVAFHHVDYDQDFLWIDDVLIGSEETTPAGSWITVTANQNSIELTGLTAGTVYEYQIKGICDETESDWTNLATFSTLDDSQKVFVNAGNWDVAANWLPEGVPSSDQKVIIRADVVIPSGVIAQAKSITQENGTITIKDGAELEYETGEVTATVEKYIAGYTSTKDNYYLISSPVGFAYSTDVENLLTDVSDYDYYYFDGTPDDDLEWRNYKHNTFNMSTGWGYLYANDAKDGVTLSWTDELLEPAYYYAGGTSTSYLTYDEEARFGTFNLMGNVYARKGYLIYYKGSWATASDVTDFYVMGDGVLVPNTNPYLMPCEGAMIQATEADQLILVATEPLNSAKNVNSALNMTVVANNKTVDVARIRFGEGLGLTKMQLDKNSTKLYMPVDGKDYAVVYTEAQGEMPVSFCAAENGNYTLSFNTENVELGYLHLIDNMTGKDVDLLSTPSYSFEAKTTDYASRFKLVFATGNADDSFAFFSNGSFVINNEGNATLQVMDVTGRMISSENINGCANVNVNAAPGVYMIRLVNGENVKVQKVVVR